MNAENQGQTYLQASDEIELAELWRTIKRGKWTALSTLGFTLAAAIAYLLVTPPIYESRASIYLGQFNGVLLEEPVPLVTRLDARFGKENKERTKATAWIERIDQDRKDERLVQFRVRAMSPAEAQVTAQKLIEEITTEHEARFQLLTHNVRDELTQVEQLARAGRSALEASNGARASDSVQPNLWAAMMYYSGELANMQERIGELKNMLEGSETSSTRVVENPVEPMKRAYPKVILTLVMALLVGAMLGLVMVFVRENVTGPRKPA